MPKAIQPDFKSLFESAPGLNLALLPDLTIVAVTDAYLLATMTNRKNIIGHHLFEIFPDNPDDSSATGISNLHISLNYVLEHRIAHNMAVQKYDIRRPDGTFEERYWSPINKPVLDSNNEVVYIIHCVDDVTGFIMAEKEQAEKEIEVEKSNFIESIINASPDIIYIYDIEEQKNIYVNEGIQINLGYTDDEIKQMGNQVLATLMHPEDFEYYLLNTYPRYATAGDKETIAHEYRMRDKKGDWHWLYCKESIFLRKSDGTPKQIFGVTSDITGSKKAAEDLRLAHQRLTHHLHNTPLAIIEWDKNFIIQKWSTQAENIFGWKETEVANKHFNDLSLVLEDDAEAVGIIGDQLMTGEVNHNSIINRNNTKAGNIIYCQWFNSVLKDEKGNVNSILSLILDITESTKADLILAGEKKVMEMIATEKQLEEVLNTVALNYESYCEGALCSILLLNDEGTHVKHGAGPSLADAFNNGIDGQAIGPFEGSCGTAAYSKERVVVSDIAADPLWVNYRDFALSFGLKASWSTPIINTEGKVYGTFAIYYKECRTPSEGDLALIDRAANQVKIVLEKYSSEAQIKKSEEKYRTLVEQASDAIFIADTTGKFITANTSACKLAQYSEEELLKMSINDFAVMEDIQKNPFHFDELKEGKTVITERVMNGKDGVELDIEITAKLLSDGRLLTFVRDISERKKAEEEIYNLNESLEQRVKDRTAELEKTNAELEEVNDLFVGREARIIELKEELEALKTKLK